MKKLLAISFLLLGLSVHGAVFSTTNAANTNVLPKLATYALQPNTVTTFPADIIFEKGISALVSTNVSIILYYNQ